MTVKEAMNKVTSKFPELKITMVVDYDQSHYVVMALKNLDDDSEIDPFYGVDKTSGTVTQFNPTGDLEKFTKTFKENVVFKRVIRKRLQ